MDIDSTTYEIVATKLLTFINGINKKPPFRVSGKEINEFKKKLNKTELKYFGKAEDLLIGDGEIKKEYHYERLKKDRSFQDFY